MNASPTYNITSLLDGVIAHHPARTALVYGKQSLTFSDLLSRVKQCARLFQARGLQPGQRVIIMIPMSPELYIALLAVIRCGAVAVFVDPWIPLRQIAAFSAFASPSGFIGIPKSHLIRLFHPLLASISISVSTGAVFFHLPARYSLKTMAAYPAEMEPAPVTPDTPALVTFTSGSSGTPKGANRTHGFLKAQHDALCQELGYLETDIDMPMFPVFALRNLAAGMSSVIPDMDFRRVSAVNPETIDRQIRDNGVTLITASPPFIDRLASLPHPPMLRKIMTGGAPVTTRQIERWHAVFPSTEIDIIYGSTEAEPVAHISSRDRLSEKGVDGFCCGTPTPLLRTRIIQIRKGAVSPEELTSLACAPGEIGELIVSGRHVCRDYFNNPEAVRDNKIIEPNGTCWHRMGDTGYFDASGRFFFTGRVHSTIFRGGKPLHAQLVEAEVEKRIPEAIRVAALEQDGQLLVVIQGPLIPDIRQRIAADRIIVTSQALPVDPRHNSKIDYTRLREQIQKGKIRHESC